MKKKSPVKNPVAEQSGDAISDTTETIRKDERKSVSISGRDIPDLPETEQLVEGGAEDAVRDKMLRAARASEEYDPRQP